MSDARVAFVQLWEQQMEVAPETQHAGEVDNTNRLRKSMSDLPGMNMCG